MAVEESVLSLSLKLAIVVTKSAPDLLKTELRLHVVVHVFVMNL